MKYNSCHSRSLRKVQRCVTKMTQRNHEGLSSGNEVWAEPWKKARWMKTWVHLRHMCSTSIQPQTSGRRFNHAFTYHRRPRGNICPASLPDHWSTQPWVVHPPGTELLEVTTLATWQPVKCILLRLVHRALIHLHSLLMLCVFCLDSADTGTSHLDVSTIPFASQY